MSYYNQLEKSLTVWRERLNVAKIKHKIAENTLENAKLEHQIGIEEKQDSYSMNILRRNVRFARERAMAFEQDVEDALNEIDKCLSELNRMDSMGVK